MTQFIPPIRIITNIYGRKKQTMKKFSIAMFAGILIPFIGFGHEGHGATNGFTITHYFIEPEHAIFTWSALAAVFVLVSYFRLKRKRSSS